MRATSFAGCFFFVVASFFNKRFAQTRFGAALEVEGIFRISGPKPNILALWSVLDGEPRARARRVALGHVALLFSRSRRQFTRSLARRRLVRTDKDLELDCVNIHVVASAFKLYLREQKVTVIPADTRADFLSVLRKFCLNVDCSLSFVVRFFSSII